MSLIERGKEESTQLVGHPDVEIFQPKAEEPEPEPEEDAAEEPVEEPVMDIMDVMAVSPPAPEPAMELEMPALDLGVGDIDIQTVGDSWSAPLGVAGVNIPGGKTSKSMDSACS